MATVHLKGLNLGPENPSGDVIEVVYKKEPFDLKPGTTNCSVEIDLVPSQEMQELGQKAEQLRDLPELEKIHAVLDLLRGTVDYAYKETIEDVRKDNTELAEWIDRHLVESGPAPKLSEVVGKGYGRCTELSRAYLWLAQHAGLRGILLESEAFAITNINRAGTDQPLFKATPPGDQAPAHAWVEIQTESRGWVPVDPSTKYIGDTDETLQVFKDAGFGAHVWIEQANVEPAEYLRSSNVTPPMEPGVDHATVHVKAKLHGPIYHFGGEPEEPTPPKHDKYKGSATLTIPDTHNRGVGLRLVSVKNPTQLDNKVI